MFLQNNKVYSLNHPAYFLRGQEDSMILAASREGLITLFNCETENVNQMNLAIEIREITFSTLTKSIALIDNATGNLIIVDFQGKVLFWDKPPRETIFQDFPESSGFQSCFFDDTEKYLWCIAKLSAADEFELQLRRVEDWSIINKITIEDKFSLSYFIFSSTGERNTVALSLLAGQDGSSVFLVKNENEVIKYREETNLQDSPVPVFSPDGREFLVQYNHESFRQYKYPDVKQIGEYYLELDQDDTVGYLICYIDENIALVNSENGLIFLIDTEKKKIIEEVIIEDHTPIPVSNYYPTLKDDNGLYTNLRGFDCFGKYIILGFTNREKTGKDSETWKDSLIVIPISKFIEQISK